MTKKKWGLLPVFLLALSAAGCGGQDTGQKAAADVDLTRLSTTVALSEVYHILADPEEYVGKQIRMSGEFSVYEDPDGEAANTYSCIITDVSACCSEMIDFVCGENARYPEDYPEPGKEITVQGVFTVYEDADLWYCQLEDATIVKK